MKKQPFRRLLYFLFLYCPLFYIKARIKHYVFIRAYTAVFSDRLVKVQIIANGEAAEVYCGYVAAPRAADIQFVILLIGENTVRRAECFVARPTYPQFLTHRAQIKPYQSVA